MLDEAFAQIAVAVSDALGGPYHDAILRWPGEPVTDEGGSIVSPGQPDAYECKAQVDICTEAMRGEAGYTDKDVRLIILAPGLSRRVDTEARLQILRGPHAGTWTIAGDSLDAMGFAFDGRGRAA